MCLLLLLSFLLGSPIATSQIYEFHNFDTRQGLYNAQVNTVLEDSTGYLWVGTGGGVYWFDGFKFNLISTDNDLPHSKVNCLFEFNSRIYTGTENGVAEISDFKVTKTLLDDENIIEIFAFNGELIAVSTDAVYSLSNLQKPEMIYGLIRDKISAAITYDSSIWIATKRNGFKSVKVVNGITEVKEYNTKEYPSSPRFVNDMVVTSKNELWFTSSDMGIGYFDGISFNKIVVSSDTRLAFSSISYDSITNSFWCGTWGYGLVNVSYNWHKIYTDKNGLPDVLINTTYVSPSGMVYCGTITQGLTQFPGSSTIYFNKESGLLSDNVRDITALDGVVYVSTYSGVSAYDNVKMVELGDELLPTAGDPLLVVDSTTLLIGKYSGAVMMLKNGVGSTLISKDQVSGEITDLLLHQDLLYVASDKRVFIFDGSVNQDTIELPDEIDKVISIYAYGQTLAMGTTNGLFLYDIEDQNLWKFNIPGDPDSDAIGQNKINQIGGEKRPDALIIATENAGIFLYDTAVSPDPLLKINRSNGLHSNTVRAFTYIEDNLILASNTDILKIEFVDDGSRNVTKLIDVNEFGYKEVNPKALFSIYGQIWVGTGFGVLRFDYDRRSERRITPPRCYLASVSGLKKTYNLDSLLELKNIVFSTNDNSFEFILNGINLNSADSYYEFWLEGLDEEPRKASDPVASYHNLSPGKYTFHYKIRDVFGNESEIQTFEFTVESPYWKNWRFLVMILAIIVVFFGIIVFTFRDRNVSLIERTSVRQSLRVYRIILFFGGIAYPTILYINALLDDRIRMSDVPPAFGIGLLFLMIGLLSFRSKTVANYIGQLVILAFIICIGHLLIINYFDKLVPSHVIALIVVTSFASIVFHTYRGIIIFSLLLVAFSVWISLNIDDPYFLPTQFIISIVAALLLSILIISIRLNLFSRLANSDSILQNIDSLVLVANKNGDIQFVSGSITKLLGYEKEEVMGKGWWDIRGPEEKQKHLSRNQEKSAVNRNQYVTQVIHKDGELRHFRWIETVLSNGNVAGVGHDITAVYHLEKEMQRLSIVAKETANGIIISSNQNKIEWVNSAFIDMTGYSISDLMGKRLLKTLVNDHLPKSERIDLPNHGSLIESYNKELQCFKKDGTPIWLNIVGTPVFDDDNNISQVVEVIQNITEKKEKDAQLQQLSLVAQQTDNYVLITDKEDRVIWVNDSFTKIFEYTREEVIGEAVYDILSLESLNPGAAADLRRAIFKDKGNYIGEFCDKTKSGNIIWVSADINAVLDDDGEIDHIISLGSNITDRKLKEFQIEQYGRTNALLHGIDSILIKEDDNETVIIEILGLILATDENILNAAYFELDFEKERGELLMCNVGGVEKEKVQIDISDYSSLESLREGKIFIAENIMDLDELSESDKELMLRGIRSYIMVPIIVGEKVIGTLGTAAKTPYYFADNDIDTYKSMADSMAIVYNQKEQARKLKENEENFRQINDSISEAFWLLDSINNKVIYVNSTLLEFFELTEEELMEDARNWTKRVHPRDKTRVVQSFNKNAYKDKFDEEFRILKSDFSIRWLRTKAYTIRDEKGRVVRMSGSAQDITEQKKTEKAILDLNDQLTSINVLNNSILNDKSIGEELYGIIQSMFNFTEILRLNILLFDFERKMAKYHFLLSNTTKIYDTQSFSLSHISQENLQKLEDFEYAWEEDLINKKDRSESDERMIRGGILSYLMFPLVHNAKVIGSLNISFASSFRLEAEAIRFIKLISEGISISLYQKVLQDQIVQDKQQLELVHKDLSDSISYAKRFQDVRLPDLSLLRNNFTGADVLYLPKDVVSGDFYWEAVYEGNLLFAAADCTGHGVPGAFMTMLFNSMLDNIINDKNIIQPHEVLLNLNNGIKSYFGSTTDSGIRDGMDIALCRYEIATGKLHFSGARRPLWILKKKTGKLERVQGAIMSIGEVGNVDRYFKTVEVNVESGDLLYLTTDGFFDQFSADNRYKFGKRNFSNLIMEFKDKDPEDIVQEMAKALINWKGNNYQIDDILVMVVKI